MKTTLIEKLRAAGYEAIAIVGPTASGKTGLSVRLALELGSEIISCDSMQIYEKMNVATAKADEGERCGVVHHMLDVLPLDRSYSAAEYSADATACARDIISRGMLPIFCGGTGLYLDGVMRGGYSECADTDPELREELSRYAVEHGNEALHGQLQKIDPEAAEKIHFNNVKRVIRAIEIARLTGKTKTLTDAENNEMKGMRIFCVCLSYHDRETLYARIEKRVGMMLEAGLVEELRTLMLDDAFMNNKTAIQAIGYKELFPYVRGEASLEQCTEELVRATRRYAKRQLTWFNGKDYINVLYCDGENGQKSTEELLSELYEMISQC